jgi:Lon protease-like protein
MTDASVSPLAMFPLGRPCLPGEVLPLHIFEPRYISMLRDLLATPDPQFGVVLIDRGSEVGGGDVRRSIGTSVAVVSIEEVAPSQFGLVVIGRERIRVLQWLDDDPYPRAFVEDWPAPIYIDADNPESSRDRLGQLFDSDSLRHVPLDKRLFTLASMLPIGALDLQSLLEADSVRAQRRVMVEILRHLEDLARFDDPHTE